MQTAQMSAAAIKAALDAGLAAWNKYDTDGVSTAESTPCPLYIVEQTLHSSIKQSHAPTSVQHTPHTQPAS